MSTVLFEAEGVSRGDREGRENVVAAASFPARVTCSNSVRGQALPAVFGGAWAVVPIRELAPLDQHLCTELAISLALHV